MAMNRIQFQPGLSMPEFFKRYGTESPERVNDFAAPFVMNLLRRLVVISVRLSPPMVVG